MWLKISIVVLIFYAGAIPLILTGHDVGRAFNDQEVYHYPTIVHFIAGLDIQDYPSATTPGYHVLIAQVARLSPDSITSLKLAGSLITAMLLAACCAVIATRYRLIDTIAIMLPAITSIYLFPAGVWLLPDNLAWLTVFISLALTLKLPDRFWPYAAAGAMLVCAVLVRQVNIWAAAVIWVRGLYGAFAATHRGSSIKHLSAAVSSTIPAFAVLLYFFWQWGAMVPPSFAGQHQTVNAVAPAFFLAVLFYYGAFYLAYLAPALQKVISDKTGMIVILCGLLVGFVLSLIARTDYNWDEGRASGIWNFVKIAPVILNRSLLLSAMSAAGGAAIAALIWFNRGLPRWIMIAGIPAFILSQMMNQFVFERYFAGFIFGLLFFILREVADGERMPSSHFRVVPPLLLALFNVMVLWRGLL